MTRLLLPSPALIISPEQQPKPGCARKCNHFSAWLPCLAGFGGDKRARNAGTRIVRTTNVSSKIPKVKANPSLTMPLLPPVRVTVPAMMTPQQCDLAGLMIASADPHEVRIDVARTRVTR